MSRALKVAPTAVLAILILILSWYGRIVQRTMRELLGLEGLLAFAALATLIFLALCSRLFQLRKGKIRWLLLSFPIGIYILSSNPEEAIHLVEYGAFALSLSWLFSNSNYRKHASYYAISAAALMGLLDESLQGINPTRVFDFRDIVINVIGGALTVLLFTPKRNDS
jgi:hypothetical protein